MIRGVVSDFGGVLTTPLIEGFLAYQDESGVSMEELAGAIGRVTKAHDENPLFELERGEISEREFRTRLQAELDPTFDLERLQELYWERLRANREMIDYMRELRGRGLRMALCTNNVREWEPHWRAKLPEIDEVFEVVVDSAFVGVRKPEPEIYRLTVERLGGVAIEDCVLVDDLEVNCAGARAIGMKAVRFEDSEQAIAEVESLLDAS